MQIDHPFLDKKIIKKMRADYCDGIKISIILDELVQEGIRNPVRLMMNAMEAFKLNMDAVSLIDVWFQSGDGHVSDDILDEQLGKKIDAQVDKWNNEGESKY